MTKRRFPCRTDDFCLIHGQDHMVSEFGNPVPYCAACEDKIDDSEREALAETLKEHKG